jgi:hypothetical protein
VKNTEDIYGSSAPGTLYSSGILEPLDKFLDEQAKSEYPDYWRASSAGQCMRKVIFERLGVPPVRPNARLNRVFEVGHIFHSWMQDATKQMNLSIASEEEIIDVDIKVVGHFDDLINKNGHLILYDYKTQNSKAFWWDKEKGKGMKYTHRMQLGTYMYMLRKKYPDLEDGRILKISKDDLMMSEEQLLWDKNIENDVVDYWTELEQYWQERKLPPCMCHVHDDGFMARDRYNPYFYNGEPCSIEWYQKWKAEQQAQEGAEVNP